MRRSDGRKTAATRESECRVVRVWNRSGHALVSSAAAAEAATLACHPTVANAWHHISAPFLLSPSFRGRELTSPSSEWVSSRRYSDRQGSFQYRQPETDYLHGGFQSFPQSTRQQYQHGPGQVGSIRTGHAGPNMGYR